MTARVMADGAAAGCDVASLQASEMGRPIYERLGFRTVVKYTAYSALASGGPSTVLRSELHPESPTRHS